MAKLPSRFGRFVLNPFTIALAYVAIGSIWIIYSDHILAFADADMSVAHVTRLQTLKGLLYITLTAGLIYLLISIAARQVASSRNALEEMKTRYLQLFESTGAIILITDGVTSTIIDANGAAERFYGWSREELAGKTMKDIEVASPAALDPDDQPPRDDGAFAYARHRVASGEERDVAVNATPLVAGSRRLCFMLINDVTERKLLERQLRQAQKMEAVGRLTGGIAHDLNNVFTVVMADADLIAAELQSSAGEVREELDDLRSAARRGAGMIRKLLSFSRGANLRPITVDLARAVEDLIPGLRRLLPENVRLTGNLSGGLVKVDPLALEQIVGNLTTNARDAMPAGGSLVLETGTGWLSPAQQYPWVRPGKYGYLRASDTGVGMDDDTQSRMFEPYFTTKLGTEGAGLGMAMVYGLVKQHEGFVLVDSKEGGGTTVTVYFPLAPTLERAEQVTIPPAEPGGGGETILLVEDEDALRRAGQRILERLGYVVTCADNGQHALELLAERGDSIDLVITDLVMPKIGGQALYDAAVLNRKDIRFLFTSGYAPTGPGAGTPLPDVPFIQKPWTFDELKRKVREVLDRKSG